MALISTNEHGYGFIDNLQKSEVRKLNNQNTTDNFIFIQTNLQKITGNGSVFVVWLMMQCM